MHHLAAATWRFTNPLHGTVIFHRNPIRNGATQVCFDIIFTPLQTATVTYRHWARETANDAEFAGWSAKPNHVGPASTLGFFDILLPQAMTGKGIGYLYHALLARTAQLQQIAMFVVEAVISDAEEALVNGIGMHNAYSHGNYYHRKPVKAYVAGIGRGLGKGWVYQPSVAIPQVP